MFPEHSEPFLEEGVDACFERCESCVDLGLMRMEEGLEVGDVEVG